MNRRTKAEISQFMQSRSNYHKKDGIFQKLSLLVYSLFLLVFVVLSVFAYYASHQKLAITLSILTILIAYLINSTRQTLRRNRQFSRFYRKNLAKIKQL